MSAVASFGRLRSWHVLRCRLRMTFRGSRLPTSVDLHFMASSPGTEAGDGDFGGRWIRGWHRHKSAARRRREKIG